jgi:hypothetical protein
MKFGIKGALDSVNLSCKNGSFTRTRNRDIQFLPSSSPLMSLDEGSSR